MHFEGIDYDALRTSICREFGIGIRKEASAAGRLGKRVASGLSKLDVTKQVPKNKETVSQISGVGKGLIYGTALAGLGALGTTVYNQYNEKSQPLYKQLANPNSGLGSATRAAAGIGGAMLAASLMNEMSRSRHSSHLV